MVFISETFWPGPGEASAPGDSTFSQAARRPTAPHLLASGTAGIGKTALALLAAAEMDSGVRMVSGRMTANEARILLSGLADRNVLLIDELHRLVQGGKGHAEWLLLLLTDNVLIGLMGPDGPEGAGTDHGDRRDRTPASCPTR